MTTKPNATTVFERMMTDLMKEELHAGMLKDCMSFDTKIVKKVPLRYRIIALGFVRKSTLEEVNQELEKNNCARLYSRSVREASLIYAFLNGYSYKEWSELLLQCEEFYRQKENDTPYFSGKSITVAALDEYIRENSDQSGDSQRTRHLTRQMQEEMVAASLGQRDFMSFLVANADSFSTVREKARYYFCKYLYAFLGYRARSYIEDLQRGVNDEETLADLTVFKGVSQLKRKKMSPAEADEFFKNASISCGEIFNAFNYFYFEYVSMDWVQILGEYYGDVTEIPVETRQKLAESLRRYDKKRYQGKNDEEVLETFIENEKAEETALDEAYSASGTSKGYQRGRAGENAVRKYIKGIIDIDRTTLICFLLFFASQCELPDEMELNEQRLTSILVECGFPGLRAADAFDFFVVQFLESDDPMEYLMEEVTDYAMDEENFFLYRTYQSSGSYDQEFSELIKTT